MIEIEKKSGRTEVACTVSLRVTPWAGRDQKERWEADKAASASGSGRAIAGSSSAQVEGAIRDCVLAVGEEVTAKQVVPFIRRLASAR
jgi:hypothetical protein